MSLKMNVSIKEDVACLISKIKDLIQKEGGSFNGDTEKGSISLGSLMGTVKGNYVVNGNVCVLEITDKPFVATQGFIESKIREALEKV